MNSGKQARTRSCPIGILGGSFDPVHHGHLRVAIEAHEALDLDHVRLVPLHTPSHRNALQTTAEVRVEMLRGIARAPIEIDLREIERGGVSYTVDTLTSLRSDWPNVPLCLLMGADSYRSLPSWHRPKEILRLAHVVVAARPGSYDHDGSGLDEIIGSAQADTVDDLHDSIAGRVFFLDIPLLPIASSELRARRATGRDIRHLVPDIVNDIIIDQGLYMA